MKYKNFFTTKKIVRWIGNLFVLFSLFFIIKKICGYDIDYKILLYSSNIITIAGMGLIYGGLVCLCSFPWKKIIEILGNIKIDWRISTRVATKANLMKYLPGNIFQFIGRNELAIVCNISHIQVAIATVIDTLENMVAVLLLSLLLYYRGLVIWIEYYGYGTFQLVFLGLLLIIAILILFWLFRDKIQNFLTSYKCLLKKQGIIVILCGILFYCVHNISMSFMYVLIFTKIVQGELLSSLSIVMGAFILSWLIGFIVPGAPGGIGIRETVMTLLLGTVLNEQDVLLSIILFRIVSTVGDLAGYGIALVLGNRFRKGDVSK